MNGPQVMTNVRKKLEKKTSLAVDAWPHSLTAKLQADCCTDLFTLVVHQEKVMQGLRESLG